MRIYIFLLGTCLVSLCGYAQNFNFQIEHLTMREGLPNYYVNHTMIDQQGFARIATNYGYARYDGYNIQVYNQPEGLQFNSQYASHQDVNGMIWLNYNLATNWEKLNEKLIEIYDPLSQTATHFNNYFAADTLLLSCGQIATITSTPGGCIWILTTEAEVYRYDGEFQKIGNFPDSIRQSYHREAEGVYPTYETIVVADEDEFYLTDRWNPFLFRMDEEGKVEKINLPEPLTWMWRGMNDNLWMLPYGATKIYEYENGKLNVTPLSAIAQRGIPKNIEAFGDTDTQGRTWVFISDVLFVFNSKGELLKEKPFKTDELKTNGLNYFTIDARDRAWLSTGYGVYIVTLQQNPFKNYLDDRGIKDTRGIFVDEQNHIFINQINLFLFDDDHRKELSKKYALNLIKEGDYLWSGAYRPIVYRFDISNLERPTIPVDSIILKKTDASSSYYTIVHNAEKTDRLWVGGRSLFGYIDKQSLQFTSYNKSGSPFFPSDNSITCFYENEEGIWIGTDGGIFLLDEEKNRIVRHFKEPFREFNIAHMYEDQAEVFWIATRGGGLLRWDRQRDEVEQFTTKEGLSNDVIYAVYEDAFGYLWLPSNYGLMRFDKETAQVYTYLPEDGLPYHEFNHTSHTRAPDGRLFFGGLKGVTAFHPKDFIGQNQPVEIPIRVLNVEVLNKEGNLIDKTSSFLQENKIALNPDESSIIVEFSLLNYGDIDGNNYAYQLEGLDNQWNYIKENYIRLNSLPYGDLTLHIKAKDGNGRWSNSELFIPIHVAKPFYLRWWFIVLTLLLIGALIYLGHRWRTLQLQKQNKKLEEEVAKRTATIRQQTERLRILDEQKSNFFLNIAHELRTPLTLISSPITLFLEREQLDHKVATFLRSIKKNTHYLLSLVEDILNLSRLDSEKLALSERPIHLHSTVEGIFAMYESYASMQGIDYHLFYDMDKGLQVIMDSTKFEKVLNNLLSNAVKFTPGGGKVELRAWDTNDHLHFQVADTGKGIHSEDMPHIFDRYFQSSQPNQSAQGGSGIGLAIAQGYTRLMQGSLSVESTLGEGSAFSLVLPKKVFTSAVQVIPEPVTEESPAVFQSSNGHVYTLLVVEDNVEMQKLLRNIMEPQYNVLQAENGVAALKVLNNNKADGIITDLMMPEMDGFELIKHIKSDEKWRFKPLLVLTARANEQDKMQALRMGVDDYIYKPFTPQEILIRTHNLLKNYQKRLNLHSSIANGEANMANADEKWLQEVETNIFELLEKTPNFRIMDVARQLHMSERHFHRRVQELTGLTANEYIKELKLYKAKRLLEAGAMKTISEVAYAIGFSSSSYFSKVYAQRFGKKPSEYF